MHYREQVRRVAETALLRKQEMKLRQCITAAGKIDWQTVLTVVSRNNYSVLPCRHSGDPLYNGLSIQQIHSKYYKYQVFQITKPYHSSSSCCVVRWSVYLLRTSTNRSTARCILYSSPRRLFLQVLHYLPSVQQRHQIAGNFTFACVARTEPNIPLK